jgi:hypothetical protein
MMEFLKKVLKVFAGKFLNFLIEVWTGRTGEILDEAHNYVNEAVLNVENICKYIKEHSEKTDLGLVEELRNLYGYKEITIDFVRLYRKEQQGKTYESEIKTAKLNLAYSIVYNRMKQEKKKWKENAIILAIQLAVNRFFK